MIRYEKRVVSIPNGTTASTLKSLSNITLDSNFPRVTGVSVLVSGDETLSLQLENNGKTIIEDTDYELLKNDYTPLNDRYLVQDFKHHNVKLQVRATSNITQDTTLTCYFKLES